uniref:Genome polyprotein n=1 Tax=Rabbit hemorrhagic disease virus 2 TaxID=1930083 RepID=A0A8F2F5E7_RHDV|nr:polyprotein [Rabbit hemorrhagic disease virus 2]
MAAMSRLTGMTTAILPAKKPLSCFLDLREKTPPCCIRAPGKLAWPVFLDQNEKEGLLDTCNKCGKWLNGFGVFGLEDLGEVCLCSVNKQQHKFGPTCLCNRAYIHDCGRWRRRSRFLKHYKALNKVIPCAYRFDERIPSPIFEGEVDDLFVELGAPTSMGFMDKKLLKKGKKLMDKFVDIDEPCLTSKDASLLDSIASDNTIRAKLEEEYGVEMVQAARDRKDFMRNLRLALDNRPANPVTWYAKLGNITEKGKQWAKKIVYGAHRVTDPLKTLASILLVGLHSTIAVDTTVMLSTFKPVNLLAILMDWTNDLTGFITTLVRLLELYGVVQATVNLIIEGVKSFWDKVVCATERCFDLLKRLFDTFEDSVPTGPTAGCLIFMAFVFSTVVGYLPNNSVITTFMKGAGKLTTFAGVVGAIRTLWVTINQHMVAKDLTSIQQKVMTVVKMANEAATLDQLEIVSCLCSDLENTLTNRCTLPSYNQHLGILNASQKVISDLHTMVLGKINMTKQRPQPVAVIFKGAPGIGKTYLVHRLARDLGCQHPSTINFGLDHFDSYTGEEVAIADEFNTCGDGESWVELFIQMVNTNPCPLNCDKAENKNKVFNSKYLLCTTNSSMILNATHPRAGAFYRRVMIVEVRNKAVESWQNTRHGSKPGKSCFSKDMSHLSFQVYPHNMPAPGFVFVGEKLAKSQVAPREYKYSELLDLIKSEHPDVASFEGANKFNFIYPDAQYEQALLMWKQYFVMYGCVARLAKSFVEDIPYNQVHISRASDPKIGGCVEYQCKFQHLWRMVPQFVLGCVNMTNQLGTPLTQQQLDRITNGVEGVTVTTVNNILPFHSQTTLINPSFIKLIWAVRKHLKGLSGVTKVAQFIWRVMTNPVDAYGTLVRTLTGAATFSDDPVSTTIICSNCTIQIHSCGGLLVRYSRDPAPVASDNVDRGDQGVDVLTDPNLISGFSWRQIAHLFVEVLSHLCANHLVNLATMAALGAVATKAFQGVKGKTKRGRGARVNLGNDEYDEWQAARREFVNAHDMTAEEYLAMKNKAAMGSDDQDSIMFRSWWTRRQLRPDEDQVTIVGKGGVRNEVIRTRARQTPKGPKTLDDGGFYDNDYEGLPGFMRHNGSGWMIHIGNGLYISNTHTARSSCSEIVTCSPTTDLCLVKGEVIRSVAQIAEGTPVSDWKKSPITTYGIKKTLSDSTKIDVLAYDGCTQTTHGDCGLPLYDSSGKIVAIHTGKLLGFSKMCTLIDLTVTKGVYETSSFFCGEPIDYRGITAHRLVGAEPRPPVSGTRYARVPGVPDEYKTGYRPANLGRGDPDSDKSLMNIAVKNLQVYQQEPKLDKVDEFIERAAADVLGYLRFLVKGERQSNLNFKAAFNTLDLSTSCGPFVPGKKIDHVKDGVMDQVLAKHLYKCWSVANSGKALHHIYACGLKDELRPLDKVKEGKKRLLWGCDVGVAVCAAAVFHNICYKLKMVARFGPIAVGVDMTSRDVDVIINNLTAKASDFLCLDYSKWDSTMSPCVVRLAIDILADCCEQTELTKSVVLTLKSHPMTILDAMIVQTKRGLPSGMPFTSVINSICHWLLWSAAVYKSCAEIGLHCSNLYEDAPFYTYGDDGVYAMTPMMVSLLPAIIDNLRDYGLSPTAADKTEYIDVCPLNKISFLKRTFELTDIGWVSKLDKSSILRQLEWSKTTSRHMVIEETHDLAKDERGVQLEELQVAAAAHGQEFFDFVCKELNRQQAYTQFSVYSYDAARKILADRKRVVSVVPDDEFVNVMEGKARAAPQGETAGTATTASVPGTTTDGMDPGVVATTSVVTTENASTSIATAGIGGPPQQMDQQETWRTNFYYNDVFTWSVADAPGNILYTVQHSPQNNPFTAVLSQMYAGWAGGMQFRFIVAGSGVFGGRLVAAVIPPGIEIGPGLEVRQFPHVVIDARSLEPVTITMPDLRPNMYHPTGNPGLVPTLVLSVYNNLINPFGGSTSAIQVTVETRPSEDFEFVMIRAPSSKTVDSISPADLLTTPVLTGVGTDNRWNGEIVGLQPVPGGFSTCNRHWNLNGSTYGWSSPRFAAIDHDRGNASFPGSSSSNVLELWYASAGSAADNPISQIAPDGFPDMSFVPFSGTTIPTAGWVGFGGIWNSSNGAPYVTTMQAYELGFATGVPSNPKPTTTTSGAQIVAKSIYGVANGINQTTAGLFVMASGVISTPNSSATTYTPQPNRIVNAPGTPAAAPIGKNTPIMFASVVRRTGDINAEAGSTNGTQYGAGSQPLPVTIGLSLNNYSSALMPGQFFVWQLNFASGFMELGLSVDGYFYAGTGASATLIDLSDLVDIRPVGPRPSTSTLVYNLGGTTNGFSYV